MPSGLLPKRGVQHVCRRTVAVARAEEAGRHDRFAQRQEVSGEAKGEAKGEKKEKKRVKTRSKNSSPVTQSRQRDFTR